jgi:hypothetical protein
MAALSSGAKAAGLIATERQMLASSAILGKKEGPYLSGDSGIDLLPVLLPHAVFHPILGYVFEPKSLILLV